MWVRSVTPWLAAFVTVLLTTFATEAVAQSQPSPAPPWMKDLPRTPVAKSAARVVKTRDGQYASVPVPRPAPHHAAAATPAAPITVPPEAARAFALAAAQVRVVSADE